MALPEDKRTIQTVLKKTEIEKLRVVAESKGLSMSAFIRMLLIQEIKEYEKENGEIEGDRT